MPDTPGHIALAERLGYRRAWLFDTPALQLDVWMTLALAAARTERIGLGPGVLIPSLRHPMVTARGDRAPGRTGTRSGQRALRWTEVAHYTKTVQALLRGETPEVDGSSVAMLHWPDQEPPRPVSVPWRFAVAGPKGFATARELNGAIFTSRPPVGAKPFGPGEAMTSPRVMAAAVHGVAVRYHLAMESGKRQLLASGAAQWRQVR